MQKKASAIDVTKLEIDTREMLIVPKRSLGEFIFLELMIYMSQVCVFGMVAFLASQAGSSEEKMVQYLQARINKDSMPEFWFLVLGVLLVLGLYGAIKKVFRPKSHYFEYISDEILLDIARAGYTFGSSITGGLLVAILYGRHNGADTSSFLGAVIIITSFALVVGGGMNWAIKRHDYIKKPAPIDDALSS